MTRPGPIDYLLLMSLGLIWGGAFMLVKVAIDEVPPFTLTAARMVIGAVMFLAIVLAAGGRFPTGLRNWLLVALSAFTGFAAPFTLISWGMEVTDAGLSAILMAAMPIFAILLSHVFVAGDHLTWAKVVGVAFGVAGVVVLIGPSALTGLGDHVLRQIALLGAAFCYAVNAIATKHISSSEPYGLSAVLLVVAATMMVPAAFLFEAPLAIEPGMASTIAVVLLGLLPTGFATLLMLALLRRTGPSFFSQINFLVPIFGVLWGMIVLAERPGPNAWISLLLILIGIAIARYGTMRRPSALPSE